MIRTDGWKLVRHHMANGDERAVRPEERPRRDGEPLLRQEGARRRATTSQARLTAWQESIDDPILKLDAAARSKWARRSGNREEPQMNTDKHRSKANRLCFYLCLYVFICGSSTFAKPNVVLIISDDHRWDAIGAAGNKAMHTPNLDRLAGSGTYYRQGTVHVPQCSPTRAMLLTGLPPHASGWYSNQAQRPDVKSPDGFKQYPLLPALMRDAGYRTVLVGKWHLAPEPWNCGFDEVRTWMPGGSGPYQDRPRRWPRATRATGRSSRGTRTRSSAPTRPNSSSRTRRRRSRSSCGSR